MEQSTKSVTVPHKQELMDMAALRMDSRDVQAQPWARQSLVQLAPVWGRIMDPQTVQTTTSDQSEQWVLQQWSQMVHVA